MTSAGRVRRFAATRGPGRTRWRFVGLPAVSVTLLSLLLTCSGALLDAVTSRSLGAWFVVAFLLASVGGAALIRAADLVWSVILPPLVFATSVLLTAPAVPGGSGGGIAAQTLELGTALTLKSTPLLAGTAAATVVAVARWLRGRRSR